MRGRTPSIRSARGEPSHLTGVVVTTHGEYGVFARACVISLLHALPVPYYLVLVINVSTDPITLELEREMQTNPSVAVVRLDEETGGLTHTWNLGVAMCLRRGCTSVLLCNHDLYVDHTIRRLADAGNRTPPTQFRYYGPLTNEPGPMPYNQVQYGTHPRKGSPHPLVDPESGLPCPVNGAVMCVPAHVLWANQYAEGAFFNPAYPYGGNEIEWFNRLLRIGGRPYLVPGTFVHHYKFASWRVAGRAARRSACIYTVDRGQELQPPAQTKGLDALFYGHRLERLREAARLGWTPMFTSSKAASYDCKVRPHRHLPSWYTRSVFVEHGVECDWVGALEQLTARYDLIIGESHELSSARWIARAHARNNAIAFAEAWLEYLRTGEEDFSHHSLPARSGVSVGLKLGGRLKEPITLASFGRHPSYMTGPDNRK